MAFGKEEKGLIGSQAMVDAITKDRVAEGQWSDLGGRYVPDVPRLDRG